MSEKAITRALLSVSDKTGLADLGAALAARGVELVSTGGTAKALREAGLAVKDVSDLTGFPEMMDGRVKTLHPKVHGGLLALRDNPEHVAAMAAHDIGAIDLVVVNLYPFEATVAKGADRAEIIENIDIGGPSMVRSAAKNHGFVTILTDPADYPALLAELEGNDGATSQAFRTRMAGKAYARTAAYERGDRRCRLLATPRGDQPALFPETSPLAFKRVADALRLCREPAPRARRSNVRSAVGRARVADRRRVAGHKELQPTDNIPHGRPMPALERRGICRVSSGSRSSSTPRRAEGDTERERIAHCASARKAALGDMRIRVLGLYGAGIQARVNTELVWREPQRGSAACSSRGGDWPRRSAEATESSPERKNCACSQRGRLPDTAPPGPRSERPSPGL